MRVTATAEEQPSAVPDAAAKATRAPRRVVTVDLATVKPDDEFEGVVVRSIAMLTHRFRKLTAILIADRRRGLWCFRQLWC